MQYAIWLEKVVQGDFGDAGGRRLGRQGGARTRIVPVARADARHAARLAAAGGAARGLDGATRETRPRKGAGQLLTVGFVFPQFWLAILLVLVFAVELHWLPAGGYDLVPRLDPWQHVER